MKIIHTSDWHLGNMLYGYDRLASEKAFLRQLKDIVAKEQPDCMIVGGDVYNLSAPSANVQKIYTNAMLDIHNACKEMTIVVTAGNHDSPAKLEIDSSLWSCFNVFVVGKIEKQDDKEDYAKHIIEIKDKDGQLTGYVAAVPHFYVRNHPDFFEGLQQYIININERNLPVILCCHLAVSGSEIKSKSKHVQDMEFYPLESLGDVYSYIALGHIHFAQTLSNSEGKARYCGSPISVSFNEQYPHSVTVIEIDKNKQTQIRTIEIQDDMSLKTVPSESKDVEEVYTYVQEHKEELKNCFLRFNVRVEDFLSSDSKDKSAKLCSEIGAYFCTFNIERKETPTENTKSRIITAEELKQLTPMDIAKDYMARKGMVLSEDFMQMIRQAMEFKSEED